MRKIKRVRIGQYYWAIGTRESTRVNNSLEVYKIMERGDSVDQEHFESGNYYPDEKEALAEKHRRDREAENARASELYHRNKRKKADTGGVTP